MKMMGMFVMMLTELEVYLDEGDGDVCDDADGTGSIPW